MHNLAVSTPPGAFAEVGVWRGGSARALLNITQAQGRELHLFDTFTGIPWKSKFDVHNIGDFDNVNFEELKTALSGAIFHVGIFPYTFLNGTRLPPLAFVHEDSDQYKSTKAVIDHLYPLLIPNGIMLFDDYNVSDCPGSRKAIDEAGFPNLIQVLHHAYVIKP